MDGALILDKPAGITSHDVVVRVRRALKIKRVGHAGTLDPFATGVLVVCVGLATRLVQYLIGLDKEYLATVRLGFATTTQDLTGDRISETIHTEKLTEDELRRAVGSFIGDQQQIPPMFSAKRLGGKRLHELARGGEVVDREPVSISIHSIELIGSSGSLLTLCEDGTSEFKMRVRCSSGTYIRTLANDLGERLGYGAHLSELRRTSVGAFGLHRSITLEELEERASADDTRGAFIAPSELLCDLQKIELADDDVLRVKHGRAIVFPRLEPGSSIRLCDGNNNLVAVGRVEPDGETIKPRTVLVGS